MKIAVISDTHLGFGTGERKNDAVVAFEEAVGIALEKSDAILFAGDMFDSPYPRSYVTLETVRILSRVKSARSNIRNFPHFPFIAISGNHERRSKEFLDPVQMLERAGLLKRLHGNAVVLEKGNEKVRVYGISSVPERLAGAIFKKLAPAPGKGMVNILMFHQSVSPYVYSPLEKPTLDISSLPEGFDIIIDGHIHKREVRKIGNSIFMINGSTILTQLKTEGDKGLNIIDTNEMSVDFIALKKQRRFIVVESERETIKDDKARISEFIESQEIKPIVKIISKNLTRSDFLEFEGRCILLFSKKKMQAERKQLEIQEIEIKGDELFESLAEGDFESVERLLQNDYKNKA